ncbi:hypothetical protein EV193_11942 [Herbihabitans rhizosphaerae]|uniref:ABM domain-containing protein n=1 Tax=Herbihabitans rhizosphaerae TaxID=1872711 RepID=A0A4Q7KDH2_9PSEU|nr:antibiotic biosynthesis monooxygenase [Herbihabitans rhizosphaerae]RZS29639.1 hypothetical protein EV193_11942 [Herbihabitans rhizosphaerae]
MLVVCRFTVPESSAAEFTARASRALELLTAARGCVRGVLGRSTETSGRPGQRWVLTVEFESVAAYRRAMSPFEVREHVIPLLSEADTTEESGYEVVITAAGGVAASRTSLVAADAETVRPGEGAGPSAAR